MEGQVPLRRLHSDATLNTPDNKKSLDFWRAQSTRTIRRSLHPGMREGLLVKENGMIVNGNTRITVLMERNIDINSLPRGAFP